jgi:hypothetical protein
MEASEVIAQLGISGIFVVAVAVIAKAYYAHYEDEIKYLRAKVDLLEAKILELTRTQNLGQR